MNVVVLSGRLTREPELRSTPSGTDVCNFSLAIDRAGDKQEDGTFGPGFFDIQCWGKTATNAAKYLNKGARCAVTGELRHHRWTTDAGDNRSKVEVNAMRVEFLETKAEREARDAGGEGSHGDYAPSGDPPSGQQTTSSDFGADDDIPF